MKPDDELPSVRTSQTGRVPQWVLDEALGKPAADTTWRAAPTAPVRRRRRRKAARIVMATLAVAGFGLFVTTNDWARTPLTGQLGAEAAQDVERQGPPPGFEESERPPAVRSATADQAEGSRFRYLRRQPQDPGRPVAWSPCRPIHVVSRPDTAPAWGAAVVAEALARTTRATGLFFVNDGPTTEAPSEDRASYQPERYGDRWAPVLIAWATPDEVPDFGIDIAGEAGPQGVRTQSGDETYVSGVVYLDPQALGQVHDRFGRATAKAIVLHELGHLVGLAHVNSQADLMFPRGQVKSTDFGAGDLAGLAALGRGDCQPDV